MNGDDINARLAEISGLLESQLHVRGRSLDVQLRRARRLLPSAVRREAQYLVQAAGLAQNPKLARMIDMAKVDSAQARVVAYLQGVDRQRRRRDRLLNLLALNAFYVLVVGIAVVAVLVWRGIV
ncbi:MAG: hypothetical protein GW886_11750 [Rhodobacterales bacterium]|nr:hypothetical protein [Rhodobacterales bacterium]NCT12058.1 hypothetical protein [Rhodobacterales bacterium]